MSDNATRKVKVYNIVVKFERVPALSYLTQYVASPKCEKEETWHVAALFDAGHHKK